MRSSANLILAISAAFVLQAGLCPALCSARSAEPTSSQLESPSPPEQAPCHGTSEAPSRGDSREDCAGDCSHFDSAALAVPGTCTVVDLPAAAFASRSSTPLPPANAVPAGDFELAPAPRPRNLLLVKNSFLI